jgi:hypothetical protein
MDRARSPHGQLSQTLLSTLCVALMTLGMMAGCERLRSFASSEPQRFLEEARLSLEQADPYSTESKVAACEAAWRPLKRIGSEHPKSTESTEAFRLASSCLKTLYDFRRYHVPDSPFVTSEPAFMLEWLVHFFDDRFPQEQVDQLLVGMPYSLFREFQASAESRPELARWTMRAKRENGRIEYVRASPAQNGSH